MRCVLRCLSTLLLLHTAVLTTDPVFSSDEPGTRTTDAPQARTELYDSFDPTQLGRKYLSRFDQHAEFNAVSNFRVTPPGHWFKTFRIKGNISADDLEQLVDSLQEELKKLAKASGVEVVAEKDDVGDRPIALLKALSPTYAVKVSTIQGRHISYRHEQALGDIDLFAFQLIEGDDGDLRRWCVICTVHEPEVTQ